MLQIVKPIPILFTFATVFGVLVHDMHIDRAATAAVALPAALATAATADFLLKSNQHTHVDRISLGKNTSAQRAPLPKAQPPRDDDKRYVQQKKLAYSGGDTSGSLWPSV